MLTKQEELEMFQTGLKTFDTLQTLLCKTDRALTVKEFCQLHHSELQNNPDFEVLAPYLLRYREHTVGQEINDNGKIVRFFRNGVQAKEKELLHDDN